jgi:small-conductance mechanosensitive channel
LKKHLIKRILRVLGWLLMPLLIYLKLTDYDLIDSWKIPLKKTDVVVNFLIFLISLNTFIYVLAYFYRKRKHYSKRQNDNLIAGLNNIYYLLVSGGVLASLLLFLGFDLFTFFTSLSIFAAALAILSKDYISNVVSGTLIAFSDEINIGDTVQIGGKKGKVTDITLSKFILLNDDDDFVILPNSTVFSNEIINYTRREIRKTSIDFEIDIKHMKNVEELEDELIASLTGFHQLIRHESYRLKIVEIKKDFVSLKFQYVLDKPDRELERDIRRATIRRVLQIILESQEKMK